MSQTVPKLVIFDLDGTLIDSIGHVISNMRRAFAMHGLPEPHGERIRPVIGRSLHLAIEELLEDGQKHHAARVVETYKSNFSLVLEQGVSFFDGALDLVHGLGRRDHVLLSIATGKGRRGLDAVLTGSGIGSLFFTTKCSDDAPSKPHPGMIEQVLSETGVDAADAVMVGDSALDMTMAQSAGVLPLGVAWGAQKPKTLLDAGARSVAPDMATLTASLDDFVGVQPLPVNA